MECEFYNKNKDTVMANEQMSLCQLRELATRQQEHIEATQRIIMSREHKLKCLKQEDAANHTLAQHEEKFARLRESVTAQEMKLRQLRALKGQVQKQRCNNSNLSSELESIRALFSEKEKELSVALAKVDALTRQLEELRKGNTTNSYHINGITNGKHAIELEKLRQELLYRTKISEQQSQDLAHKKGLLAQRQSEMVKIDERISELQQRLARKRQLNQQLSSQMHSNLNRTQNNTNEIGKCLNSGNPILRSSIGHPGHGHGHKLRPLSANIAAVEPLQREQKNDQQNESNIHDFIGSKMDPKYQTLPYNTKFGMRSHKLGNYLSELTINNKSESESSIVNAKVNINGMLINGNGNSNMSNNNSSNGTVPASLNTNGMSKLAKGTFIEERPSPSGSSSCSSAEHSHLNIQNQHNLHHLQNYNANSRVSPLKTNVNTSNNNNNNSQQQYSHIQQKQYQQQQYQQQQHYYQQTQQQRKVVPNIDSGTNNVKLPATVLPIKPFLSSQKCPHIASQNCPVPTTLTSTSTSAVVPDSSHLMHQKHKPVLPPKPSVPVKPIPPPRQTPAIDSVDNAIALYKVNTFDKRGPSPCIANTSVCSTVSASSASSSASSPNYRYPLTAMGMQRTYNAINAKSGLMSQQMMPQHQSQSNHHYHHHNHSPYEDKSVPTVNLKNCEFLSSPDPTAVSLVNVMQECANLNGQSVIGSDLTSSTSSLSSSLSTYNTNSNNNSDDIKSMAVSNNIDKDTVTAHSNQMTITKNNNINNNNSNKSTTTIDWHKVKRRPVIVDNEMENELAMQIDVVNALSTSIERNSDSSAKTISQSQSQMGIDLSLTSSDLQTSQCEITKTDKTKEMENNDSGCSISVVEVASVNAIPQQTEHTGSALIDALQVESSPSPQPIQSQPQPNEVLSPSGKNCIGGVKRTKGNLKSQQHASQVKSEGSGSSGSSSGSSFGAITRRVSFDPLALLLDAALEGELELVKKTASEVPNPSATNDEGITALHNAICAGHFDIVKYLVENGCDVNAPDSDGWTPLHCAASCNRLSMVKFLIEHGACIFATTLSDQETAAEKCEEDEEGFDGCSQYLYGVQEKLGILNASTVYAVYDYDSQNLDELCFKDGDRITVIRRGDEQEREWWWSKIKDREGYVPRNLLGLYPRIKSTREYQQQQINEDHCA